MLLSKTQLLPNENNLDGIAVAIIRLQELYRLDPKDMTGEFHNYLLLNGTYLLLYIICSFTHVYHFIILCYFKG